MTLLERDRSPVYHIGESILPSCRPISRHLPGEASGDPNSLANLNREHELRQAPTTAENAVGGLYLVTEPWLGLARAELTTTQ